MARISIVGSIGKGEADYTTEGEPGEEYTYFPLPGGGYEYNYAVFMDKQITTYPVVVKFQDTHKSLFVFYRTIKPPEVIKEPPKGETLMETVGASCRIMAHDFAFGRFFYLRHDVQGNLTAYDSDIRDIRNRVKDFPICDVPVATEARKIDALDKKIDSGLKSLQQSISQAANTLSDKLNGVKSGLEAMINGIAAGLSTRITKTEDSIKEINGSLFDIGRFIGGIDDWFIDMFFRMKETVIEWITEAFIGIVVKVLNTEVKK